MRAWFWWLVGLNLFDIVFTLLALKHLGFVELNPLGLELGMFIKVIGLVGLGFAVYSKYAKFTAVKIGLLTLIVWYAAWTIIHLYRLWA